jgi:ATP-binding cassette subfamily F protein uup
VIGGYQDYLAKRKGNQPPAQSVKSNPKDTKTASQPGKTAKLNYIQNYELENLPKEIIKLEKEIAYIENRLADPELYTTDSELFDKLTRDLEQTKNILRSAEERWLELEELRISLET